MPNIKKLSTKNSIVFVTDMNKIINEINVMPQEIAALTATIASLTNTITSLSESITNIISGVTYINGATNSLANAEVIFYNIGESFTVDLTNQTNFNISFGENSEQGSLISFINPIATGAIYYLTVNQGRGTNSINWNASGVRIPNGVIFSTAENQIDFLTLVFDGTSYIVTSVELDIRPLS